MTSPRTVLITGGSQGIGFATARKCLAEGCRVILVARDQAKLAAARDRLVAESHPADRIHLATADMADPASLPGFVATLPWLDEGLWGLVPNAALEILGLAKTYPLADLLQTLQVNVVSPIVLIQACHAALARARGNIVYVGSIADFKNDPRYSIYGGSKAFMKAFVGHAGQELGPEGIRINLVSPGATDTELMQRMRFVEKAWPEEHVEKFLQTIPIEQRMARPDEIADAIWFALSGPRYFHGEDLRIYGGHK